MSSTIRIRNHPVVLIAAALVAAGSAAAVAHGPLTHSARNATTTIDAPYTQQGTGPALHGLTPVDREAAQRLADLRAQRAADFQCNGPAYPAHPC